MCAELPPGESLTPGLGVLISMSTPRCGPTAVSACFACWRMEHHLSTLLWIFGVNRDQLFVVHF